jgi:hypothetical protein
MKYMFSQEKVITLDAMALSFGSSTIVFTESVVNNHIVSFPHPCTE